MHSTWYTVSSAMLVVRDSLSLSTLISRCTIRMSAIICGAEARVEGGGGRGGGVHQK